MGASNFDTTVYTSKSMRDAYADAVEQARYEFGAEPYNGTISTTNGVIASPLSSTPVREDQIDWEAISKRLDHLRKWENCEALPIKAVQPAQYREVGVIEVETRLPSALFEKDVDYGERHAEFQKAFLREVRKALKAGKALHLLHSTLGRNANTVTAGKVDLPALDVHQVSATPEAHGYRTSTQATAGKTKTRYFILKEGQREMPRWESGFASQAEARARLPKTPSNAPRFSTSSREVYEVISMSRRASGEALVTHEVTLGQRGKTVPVRLKGRLEQCTQKAKVTGETGWLFYGWAAS